MYRLVRKLEDSKDNDPKCEIYAKKMVNAYTADTVKNLKESIKNNEAESIRIDLDELFKISRIKPESTESNLIKADPSLIEIVRMASYIFNQKAMVALTKEKYRLALQNLVKAINVGTKIVLSTGDIFMHFVMLVNGAFVLFKLDKVADAIAFCNQALLLGEQALNELTLNKGTSAKDCTEAAKTFTFALFFVRGGDSFGTKGKEPDIEQVDVNDFRQKDTFGSCYLRLTSCWLKY
jgi:hypothetical protein